MPILLDVVRATSREGGSVSPSPDRTVCGLTRESALVDGAGTGAGAMAGAMAGANLGAGRGTRTGAGRGTRTVKPSRLKRNKARIREYESRALATIPVAVIAETMKVCDAAVVNAARIHGVPVLGALLATGPARLTLDFLQTALEEHGALTAAEARQRARAQA
jgi:hypothetical protein